CPVLVSPEVGKRDSAWRYQRVLVRRGLFLRVQNREKRQNEHGDGCDENREQEETSHLGSRSERLFSLFFLVKFCVRLRHRLSLHSAASVSIFQTGAIRPDVREAKQLDYGIGDTFVSGVRAEGFFVPIDVEGWPDVYPR